MPESNDGDTCDAFVPANLQDEETLSEAVGPPMEENEEARQKIVDEIAEYMMINRCGFSLSTKETFPLEWDRTHEDSQLALMIGDIEMIFDYLEEVYGYDFSKQPLNDN